MDVVVVAADGVVELVAWAPWLSDGVEASWACRRRLREVLEQLARRFASLWPRNVFACVSVLDRYRCVWLNRVRESLRSPIRP